AIEPRLDILQLKFVGLLPNSSVGGLLGHLQGIAGREKAHPYGDDCGDCGENGSVVARPPSGRRCSDCGLLYHAILPLMFAAYEGTLIVCYPGRRGTCLYFVLLVADDAAS